MRIEVKRKTVEARCRSDTVEKEDGKLGQSFCAKICIKSEKQLKNISFLHKNIC